MTFTLQDLKHLEIMAELEEKPVVLPEESITTVVAAPVSLTEKLLTLATKLRTAGFVQQAESLESTFGMYKKAETDASLLYRAHAETGDDLLEFAHPDGDVEVAPAQDHHGDVETPISQHKKIIDIVQRASVLDMLKKTLNIKVAQTTDQKQTLDTLYSQAKENLKKFQQIYVSILKKLDERTDFNESSFNFFERMLNKIPMRSGKTITVYDYDAAEEGLSNLLQQLVSEFEPGFFNSGKENLWKDEILPMISIANKYVASWAPIITNIRKIETEQKTSSVKQYDPDAKVEQVATQELANDPYNILVANMDKAVIAIDHKINVLNISKPEGFDKTLSWLAKAKTLILADKTALNTNPEKKNKEVLDLYTAKFNTKNEKLKAAGVI